MAQVFNMQFYKGEDVVLPFSPASGNTQDITGWTILLTVKKSDADLSALIAVSGVVTNGPGGLFTIQITSAQSQTLGTGLLYFDVWRTDVPTNAALAIGRMSVLPNPRFGT